MERSRALWERLSGGRLPVAVVCAIALGSLLISVFVHPFLREIDALDEQDQQQTRSGTVRLARFNRTVLFGSDREVIATSTREWPEGGGRDAIAIELPADRDHTGASSGAFVNLVGVALLARGVQPMALRQYHLTHEPGDLSEANLADPSSKAFLAMLQTFEPKDQALEDGRVIAFRLPDGLPYVDRTGINWILGVVVDRHADPGTEENEEKPSRDGARHLQHLKIAFAHLLRSADEHDVRHLAIPFIGVSGGDRADQQVYATLLDAIVKEAGEGTSLRSVYIGTFAQTAPRQREHWKGLSDAWEAQRLQLAESGQLVDSTWRMSSLIAFFAVASFWRRRRVTVKLALTLGLLATGFATYAAHAADMVSKVASPPVAVGVGVVMTILIGLFTPNLAAFDVEGTLKEEIGKDA